MKSLYIPNIGYITLEMTRLRRIRRMKYKLGSRGCRIYLIASKCLVSCHDFA